MLIALNCLVAFLGAILGTLLGFYGIEKYKKKRPQTYEHKEIVGSPGKGVRVVVRNDKAIRQSEIRRNEYHG